MINKMMDDLAKEITNLKARRANAVEGAIRRLTNDVRSIHLGHNLGSDANEISEYDAKIGQTEMILADLRARVALEGK